MIDFILSAFFAFRTSLFTLKRIIKTTISEKKPSLNWNKSLYILLDFLVEVVVGVLLTLALRNFLFFIMSLFSAPVSTRLSWALLLSRCCFDVEVDVDAAAADDDDDSSYIAFIFLLFRCVLLSKIFENRTVGVFWVWWWFCCCCCCCCSNISNQCDWLRRLHRFSSSFSSSCYNRSRYNRIDQIREIIRRYFSLTLLMR